MLFAASMLSPWVREHRRDVPYAAGLLLLICTVNLFLAGRTILGAPSHQKFRGVSEYLLEHAPSQTVANSQWNQYPFLYYWNSRNRYLVGVDPTFFYLADPQRYWLWRHLSDDQTTTCAAEHCTPSDLRDIARTFAETLGAKLILTEHDRNPNLESALRAHPGIDEVYRDDAVSLYRIR